MSDTPLAERLEADAERWDLDHCCSVDVADLRAAVAQLRQLDRIKAPDVVAEVTQRVAEMRGIAKMIEADPHGIANEDDVWQWRRDAALLAAAYLDEPDALEADDGA